MAGEADAILFHWDADGVATAALLARATGSPARLQVIKPIGAYSSTTIPREGVVVVVDYGIPGPELDRAARPGLGVLDHHRVPPPGRLGAYCNPVAMGLAGEDDYPSCSLLAYRVLGEPGGVEERLLAALGIAGDLAPLIDAGIRHPGIGMLEELVEGTGYTVQALRETAEAIDSAYRQGDAGCLERAAEVARDAGLAGLAALDCIWRARDRARRELEEALQALEPLWAEGPLVAYRLRHPGRVTSHVGRHLSARAPDKIIVLVHEKPGGRTTIYIRSLTRSLQRLRRLLEAHGYRVAGKDMVLVVEVDNVGVQGLLEAIRGYTLPR